MYCDISYMYACLSVDFCVAVLFVTYMNLGCFVEACQHSCNGRRIRERKSQDWWGVNGITKFCQIIKIYLQSLKLIIISEELFKKHHSIGYKGHWNKIHRQCHGQAHNFLMTLISLCLLILKVHFSLYMYSEGSSFGKI